MKLSVLALDFDGTIAHDDVVDAPVREAIAAARTGGITVLLVTGRVLDDLRRAAGDLHFVDGVIAENGAVVYFPDSDHTSLLGPPVVESFVAELRRRNIGCRPGQCLVDAHANDAARILEVIRALELPLALLFNRSRVMVLPQGISKATGLHAALKMLRLSARNMLAIGDAENDHEMLRIAEVGAGVEWGSTSLKSAADCVVTGSQPAAIAAYLLPLAKTGRLPSPARPRRHLRLGYTEDGRELSLAVRGRNVLIAGDAKSGKSWIAGLLCEQLILLGYCVCVLDPEGDYRSLEALPGVTMLGGDDPPPTPRELGRALRYPDHSIVIDLSHLPHDAKTEYIRATLPALNVMRRRTGLPHRILLDEAHYFLHDASAAHLLDFELNGYTVVTYNASRLPQELLAASDVIIVTCESDPVEVEALRKCCSACQRADAPQWSQLSRLGPAQALALPVTEETGGELRVFTIEKRLTPHVRHREKYVDVPVTESRAFVFTEDGHPARRARTLRQFVESVGRVSGSSVAGYLQRGDFSRWIDDVFGDRALADDLKMYEDRYQIEPTVDVVSDIANAIRSRYDLTVGA